VARKTMRGTTSGTCFNGPTTCSSSFRSVPKLLNMSAALEVLVKLEMMDTRNMTDGGERVKKHAYKVSVALHGPPISPAVSSQHTPADFQGSCPPVQPQNRFTAGSGTHVIARAVCCKMGGKSRPK